MAPIDEDNITIITKFTDTIIIIRSRMTRIGEILESGSKAARWRGGWPLSLLVVRSRVSSPICALLLSISRGISPFPTFAKIFLSGMDAPPRGEGGVPRPVPHCGEGGVPRPAP